MTRILRVPRQAALAAIAVLVAAASLVSFGESYRGLYDWASRHGLHGPWALAWPLQVDSFIAVGELALFVALADRWRPRSRVAAWAVTLAGLAVSVAGNIGHIAGHAVTDRATAAVPPLAAAAALAVGLGVLKRVVGVHPAAEPDPTTERAALAGELAAALAGLASELRTGLAAPAAPEHVPAPVPGVRPEARPGTPRVRTRSAPGARTRTRTPRVPGVRTRSALVTPEDAEREFMSELAAGTLPSIREVRARLHVGQDRATELRQHLETLTTART